ncbi:MAG: hypothetical protein PSW75_04300, partial [bacterium]|nr:hypothetical protein [bacterium]
VEGIIAPGNSIGTLTIDGPRRTWNYSADRYGPAAKLHTWIAAPDAVVSEKQGELTYIKGDFAQFPYLETAGAHFFTPWLTLLKPAAAELQDFTVRALESGQHTAFVVRSGNEATLIAAGNRAAFALEGIETDAEIVIVRRDSAGKVLNHFVHGATYLRVGGQTLPLP